MIQNSLKDAAAGRLWVDPTVAIESHKATEQWLDSLREMSKEASKIPKLTGMPDIAAAQQLAAKFDGMVTKPGTGLRARIDQFITAGENIRDLFYYSIKKFEDTDQDCADYLRLLAHTK